MDTSVTKEKHEKFVDPCAYLKGCVNIPEGNRIKTVLRTAERAEFVTLEDETGRIYGEVSNLCEPYDFTTHVFYLPEGFLEAPVTVHFLNRMKKSAFFQSRREAGKTLLQPSMVTSAEIKTLEEEYDNQVLPVGEESGEVTDGVIYRILECKNRNGAPVKAYLLTVDTRKAGFMTGTALNGYAAHDAIETVEGQANAAVAAGIPVVAAVNADFYDMFGDYAPSGLCVKDGRSVANAYTLRNFFGVDRQGNPVIGNFRENPELIGQLFSAVGGREIFLRDGEIADFSPGEPFASIAHPRTAVGIKKDGNVVILVVDGRIPERSNGASLIDLGRLMQRFDVQTAINLDGGGSSTFLVKEGDGFRLLNRPADLHRPLEPLIRPIYNSLQVVKK